MMMVLSLNYKVDMMMVLSLNCGSWMVNSSRCVFISLAENGFCVYEFILQRLRNYTTLL